MIEKYYLHRIQRENGTFSKGIEVHDTLDEAALSYWGRVKLGFNANPAIDFLSVKITDNSGNVVGSYDLTWVKEGVSLGTICFVHRIILDGENFNKAIDVCNNFDAARSAYAAAMEYGYNNPVHTEVSYVACEITDNGGIIMRPYKGMWAKKDPEPEPEPEV